MSKHPNANRSNGTIPFSNIPDNFLSPGLAFDPEPLASKIFFKVTRTKSIVPRVDEDINSAVLGSRSGAGQDIEGRVDGNEHHLHHLSRIKQSMKGQVKATKDVWVDLIERQAKNHKAKPGRIAHKRRGSNFSTSGGES